MTRTKIGPLVAFALILVSTIQGANAASPNSVIASIKHSTVEAELIQKVLQTTTLLVLAVTTRAAVKWPTAPGSGSSIVRVSFFWRPWRWRGF
jgi:hypothetical protein